MSLGPVAGGGFGGTMSAAGAPTGNGSGGAGAGGIAGGGATQGGMATAGAGGSATPPNPNPSDTSTHDSGGGTTTDEGSSTSVGETSTGPVHTPTGSTGDTDETGSGETATSGGSSTTGSSTTDTTGEGNGDQTAQSAGCGQMRTLMNGRRTIQSNGNREYILRVPDNYDNNKPYRLIFAFHWLNGNATQVAEGGNGGSTEDPFYGLWDLAENSTIFVAPEGLNAGWGNMGDQDIAFADAILAEVQNDLCIDTTRIFSTGFSYGAAMSYALACARADVFRGVVLYAGALLSGCNGGNTPIAYMHVHGVSDSVLSVGQGRQIRDRFVNVNGCTPQDPQDVAPGSGTHRCSSYEGCTEGYPLRWCTHGGDHNPTEKDSGQAKSWIPGEAWAFISQF